MNNLNKATLAIIGLIAIIPLRIEAEVLCKKSNNTVVSRFDQCKPGQRTLSQFEGIRNIYDGGYNEVHNSLEMQFVSESSKVVFYNLAPSEVLSGSAVASATWYISDIHVSASTNITPSLCFQKLKLDAKGIEVPDGPVTSFHSATNIQVISSNAGSSLFPAADSITGLTGTYSVGYCLRFNSPLFDGVEYPLNVSGINGWIQRAQLGD